MSVKWTGDAVAAAVSKAMKGALKTGAEMVLAKSAEEVPLKWADLLRSGTVNPADGGNKQVASYNTPYAIEQHENLDNEHLPGRKAKYLEDPLNANGGKVITLIANAAKQAMKG